MEARILVVDDESIIRRIWSNMSSFLNLGKFVGIFDTTK